MARLKGLEVKVLINGVNAREYDDDSDADTETKPDVITKYIQSISEASFHIVVEAHPTHDFTADCLSFHVFVDGSLVEKRALPREYSDKTGACKSSIAGISREQGGRDKFKEFKFAEIVTGKSPSPPSVIRVSYHVDINVHPDDRPHERNIETLKNQLMNLGTISVAVWAKMTWNPKTNVASVPQLGPAMSALGTIPEKAVKGRALSHSTR